MLFDLQYLSPEEEGGEAVGNEPEDSGEQVEKSGEEAEGEQQEEAEGRPLPQEEIDRIVKNRLKRWERKWAKTMGVKDMNEASEMATAGKTVSQRAGIPAREVVSRLNRQVQNQAGQQGQTGQAIPEEMRQEIQEMKDMMEDEKFQKVRQQEEKKARQEFGKLFDDHQDDIEDKAEEKGLTLDEAAAIVLQPKVKEQAQKEAQAQKEVKRKRKVEGTDERAEESETTDYASKLTPQMKRVAQKQGMSYKKYYEQAKATGLLD